MFDKLFGFFRPQKASGNRVSGPIGYGRPVRNRAPESKPGIYRITSKKDGKPIYIGVANDLSRRYAEHKRSGKFEPDEHHFEYQSANDGVRADELYNHEKKKIKKHKPRMNQRNGGGGRPW